MTTKCLTLSLVLACFSGCLQEEAEPMQAAPQDMSKAVFYHYGQPDGVSKNAVFGDAPESGLRSAARKAEPIVQLELTNKISEAGLEVHADGSVTKAPWQPAYTRIQEGLADLPVEAADLPQYVIDQMVVQKMVHYTDLLDDTLASDERIALSREFLDVLVANNYPDPTIVARLLESVGSSLDVEESRRVASKALAAQRRYTSELQPMADECPECFANKVKGYTPDARTRYDESVRKLEAIEAASN